MLTLLGSFALTSLALSPSNPPVDGGRWIADYDEAVKIATAEKKDLLVDFTGSDWCGWCIKLHDEVFQHEAFYAEAEKHFVLVSLDFPNSPEVKAKVPNPTRNAELRDKYGIRGYPTILLMNVEGQVFGQTGYQQGGPEAYNLHLSEISTAGREGLVQVSKLTEAFKLAKERPAKLKAISNALAFIESSKASDSILEPLLDLAREGLTLDADNKDGVALRSLETLLTKGAWNSDLDAVALRLDPKNERGLIEKCLEGQIQQVSDDTAAGAFCTSLLAFKDQGFAIKDKSMVASFAFNAARWNSMEELLDDSAMAITFGEWALALDPEGDNADAIKAMLEEVRERTPTEG